MCPDLLDQGTDPSLEASLKGLWAEVRRGKLPPPTLLVDAFKYPPKRVDAVATSALIAFNG